MPGVILMFFAALAAYAVAQWVALNDPHTPSVVKTAHVDNEIDQYRIFVEQAVNYMKANPTASGTFYWPSIASALTLPPSLVSAGMPGTWRIVANGTSYVLCTEMANEQTPGNLAVQLDGRPEKINRVGDKWVVGDPADTTALTTEASKCS